MNTSALRNRQNEIFNLLWRIDHQIRPVDRQELVAEMHDNEQQLLARAEKESALRSRQGEITKQLRGNVPSIVRLELVAEFNRICIELQS